MSLVHGRDDYRNAANTFCRLSTHATEEIDGEIFRIQSSPFLCKITCPDCRVSIMAYIAENWEEWHSNTRLNTYTAEIEVI